MPRKFSSFFKPGENPGYGDDFALIHGDFPRLILRALAAHAGIDPARSLAFACMFHQQGHLAALTYNRLMFSGNLIPVMDAAADAYMSPEQLDFYDAVKRLTSGTDKNRNILAHSYYMGSPAIGDAGVLLMSPSHWVLKHGEHVTFVSNRRGRAEGAQAQGRIEKWGSPFNPEEMMVYGRGDLEAMRQQMASAQDAWLAFAKWVWPDISPVSFPNPLGFLLAQAPILRVVNERREKRGESPHAAER